MDTLVEDHVVVEEHFMNPSAEYPDGSYMQKVAGKVVVATGHYATLYPDKPSYYWHGKPPVAFIDTSEWRKSTPEQETEKLSQIAQSTALKLR